jgi:deoxyribodipyrimidine photo-lyase
MEIPARPAVDFAPCRFTALRRALSMDAAGYAARRNHLDGGVSALSPYVTHGVLPDRELFALWRERFGLTLDDALLRQLAWRGFFHHVRRRHGDAILGDLHPAAHARHIQYRNALPGDLLTARTGLHVIDASVKQLYATGWLHNHQRLWLASYCVHLRKVHWRVGADWMLGYLLDGDIASNHLSWQWVAGTFSSKPYLFNAANVARFAPHLASPGAVIDTDYETLAQLAASDVDVGPAPCRSEACEPPPLRVRPPQRLPAADFARLTRGRRVALLHPWDLARRPEADCVLGVILLPFHMRFPWSDKRWEFVITRMRRLCDAIWVGRPAQLAQVLHGSLAAQVSAPPEPDYAAALSALPLRIDTPAPWLPEPDTSMPSFSAWTRWMRRDHPEYFATAATATRRFQ